MAVSEVLDVDQDALAGVAGEEVAGEDGEDLVGFAARAVLVDNAEAVGVAVPGDTAVGAVLEDGGAKGGHGAGVLGVGEVVRVGPVELRVDFDDLAADAAQGLGPREGGDPIAGIGDDFEGAAQREAPAQEVPVFGLGVALMPCALAALRSRGGRRARAPSGSRRARGGCPPAPAS